MVSWSLYKRLKPHDLGPTWAFGFYASLKKDTILKSYFNIFFSCVSAENTGFCQWSAFTLSPHLCMRCAEERKGGDEPVDCSGLSGFLLIQGEKFLSSSVIVTVIPNRNESKEENCLGFKCVFISNYPSEICFSFINCC